MKPSRPTARARHAWPLALLLPAWAAAQVPAKCLEIESILVDACIDLQQCPGATEGQNEMVRFRTGPAAIALNELEAQWPNNGWNGLVQDASTAALTAALNATIQGCGWLVEPPGGVIPPGSQVLLVTSTQMCVPANSFATLADTLFIVFQAPGNSSGHFANHNNGGSITPAPTGASSLRTLILTYLPTACSDTATYDRAQLVNIYGTYGGSAADNDGSTVVFSWPGPPVATYVNYGCQAPFVPTLVAVDDAVGSICNGTGSVQLTGSAVGSDIVSVQWQGGTGTFSPPDALSTVYTAGAGDTGPVTVQLCAYGACGQPICVDYILPGGTEPNVLITGSGPFFLCPGQTLTLTASGADTYEWNTQETTASITVTQPGTYLVYGTNACGTGGAMVEVTTAIGPTLMITPNGSTALCPGQSLMLTASGANTFTWSTGAGTAAITVSQPGTYTVYGTNACGTDSLSIEITDASSPSVRITAIGPDALCPGQSVTLIASGADSYTWSTQQTGDSITVSQPGTYTVTGTNACGAATAQATVAAVDISAAFIAAPDEGEAPLAVAFANGSTPVDGAMHWSFGDGEESTDHSPGHTYAEPGTYEVTLTVRSQGCTAIATGQVVVRDGSGSGPSAITVPNVFTPNGDGVNDQFRVEGTGLESLDARIYNRYGEEVARLVRPRQAWDGRTFAGEPVPEGTYFYVVAARGADGQDYALKGALTLLR